MKSLVMGLVALIASTLALANPVVELDTSEGKITLELNAEAAPKTTANFLEYARNGFYDGTIFHRVIDGFMIQGGGFDPAMNQKETRAPISNEAKNGLKNAVGTIAMARTKDPHSATAQFFINVADNTSLDYPSFDGWGYAVFGKVTDGLDIVQKIAKVRTTRKGYHGDVPVEDVVIRSARVVSDQ